ncbi:unnamed protein product, partial [Discosporangium mesarthrocarpum]
MKRTGYKEIRVIGKGSQGVVTLVKDEEHHNLCVLKRVSLELLNDNEKAAALQECNLLKDLHHANIVEYIRSFIDNDGDDGVPTLNLVMQYCAGGDLASHIKNQARRKVHYEEHQILDWFSQMALAVAYVHNRHILHRDLKVEVILL